MTGTARIFAAWILACHQVRAAPAPASNPIKNHLKAHVDLANEDHRLEVRSLLTADGEGSILVTLPKGGFVALSARDREWIGGVSNPWSDTAEVEILIERDRSTGLAVISVLRFRVKADRLHDYMAYKCGRKGHPGESEKLSGLSAEITLVGDPGRDAGAPDQGAVSALGSSTDSARGGSASGAPARQ